MGRIRRSLSSKNKSHSLGIDREADGLATNFGSSKKGRQRLSFCGITLLAHANVDVLIIIDISLIQQNKYTI